MKNTTGKKLITTITLVILTTASLLTLSTSTIAAVELVPVEGARYNASDSMPNNLRLFIGKRVNVLLNSGKTIAGYVKDVGEKFVHLEKLDGKEFYDALIRIERINSIDIQFRSPKR